MYDFRLLAQEFDELYKKEETYDPKHHTFEFVAAKCYDHVWVAALALNCTESYLESIGKAKVLSTLFSFHEYGKKVCLL